MTDSRLHFPEAVADLPPLPPIPSAGALGFRRAVEADLPFLRRVYADQRADELARVPWPQALRATFLDQQFGLQHRHVVQHHPEADFLIVSLAGSGGGGADIGRLYLDRTRPFWRLIDIGLAANRQGHGHGTTLIGWLQAGASTARADGVDLHVAKDNPRAATLYRRLGFRDAGAGLASHDRMLWEAPPVTARPRAS